MLLPGLLEGRLRWIEIGGEGGVTMEDITKIVPSVSLCHDIEGRRLRINVDLPGIDDPFRKERFFAL
jgi:hypothetical protein